MLRFLNKELENKKKNQMEMKNTIAKMKNTLEVINSRLNDTKRWISKLEDSTKSHWYLIKKKKEWNAVRPV